MQQGNPYPPKYLENYEDLTQISKELQPLQHINAPLEDKSTFFLIRAPTKDNVHRAIKYGVWTSSSRNNLKLNDAQQPVYLLFNVTQSSNFVGIARVISPFREKQHFKYWAEENKWFGTFQIEWIFIKDIPYIELSTIKQTSNKAIHELIDCTPLEGGEEIYNKFQQAPFKSSLLASFKDLDVSEQKKRKDRDSNPIFDQQFQEYISVFEQMPFSFSVASYQRRKLQQTQYELYSQYAYYYQTPWQGVAQASLWNQNIQTNPNQNPQGFYQPPRQKQPEESQPRTKKPLKNPKK